MAKKPQKTAMLDRVLGERIYTRPGFLARQLHRITAAIFDEETASFGLTGLQYGILNVVEVDQTGNPFIDELLAEPLAIEDGRLLLGDRPGLGIELDLDVVRRLRADYGDRMKDGNYSDLIFGPEFASVAPPYEQ